MEQLTGFKKNSKCHFCRTSKNDYLTYGPIYKLGKITVHYYCLLLSNRLIQNGNDEEGILGFLLSDIQSELQRTTNILCIYCKRRNATITCAASKCRKNFHFPCGLKNGSSHQFVHQFKSFCHTHRLVQNIPERILKDAYKTQTVCCICQEDVNVKEKRNILWAPCCRKTWYHRKCVQKLAHSAGYFCRCPACNDAKKFNEWMQRFGIFIPQQDASWELVPNAFEDLLFRYNKCDAEDCKCPGGRQTNTENTRWEIVLCESCGSQGIHVACGNLKFLDPEWECPPCQRITKTKSSISSEDSSDPCRADEGSSKQLKLSEVGQKKRRRSSEDFENSVLDKRKKFRGNLEDEEVEIDVVTVDEEASTDEKISTEPMDKSRDVEVICDVQPEEEKTIQKYDAQEVLTLLKPGPLSYKLSLIRRVCGDFLPATLLQQEESGSGKPTPQQTDLIDLSNTDDEKETDSDIEIIEEPAKQTETKADARDREMANSGVFSLDNFEILGLVSVQKSKGGNSLCVQLSESTGAREQRHSLNRPISFLKPMTAHSGQEIPLRGCRCTGATVKEGVQILDDDVIIVTD